MKIRRTYGATMREALAQVKLEQGPDAVILGNKKVPGGVEILSAVDFDQRQLDRYVARDKQEAQRERQAMPKPSAPATSPRQPADEDRVPDFILNQSGEQRLEPTLGWPQQRTESAPEKAVPEHKDYASPIRVPKAAVGKTDPTQAPLKDRPPFGGQSPARVNKGRALPVEQEVMARHSQAESLLKDLRENEYHRQAVQVDSRPMIDEVKDELKNLRELMTSQLNVLEWDRYTQRNPVRSVLLNLMSEMGLGTDVTEMIFNHLGQMNDDPHKVWQQALGLLASAIPISGTDILSSGGRIALVGSTGVGKTTTIAKMAARFAHKYGKQSVALVTTDNFRIGAHEQLQQFARMLEIPLLTANTAEELGDRLKMLADKRLVLIDTAGMSQNDVRLSEQFHKLQHGSPEVRPYLVLSANTQLAALSETVRNFKKVKLGGAIVTKLDESASLGGIITAAIRHQLPLTYVGTGQQVPEDLHQAKNHRLVSKAVSLMQSHAENCDPETLAFRFNHIISQPRG
jgi:flagellar biosynthesis protein FlhF